MPLLENAHALVAGIANYRFVNPLSEVVLNDARAIQKLLVDPDYCGYPRDQVITRLDGNATADALRQALAELAQQTNSDSTVLIYFSGHGGRIRSGTYAGEYLLPVDATAAGDRALAESSISGGELTAALRAIPAGKLVMILDCCHAGGIGQPKYATALEFKRGLSDQYYDQLRTGRGRVIFASSRNNEFSWVLPDAPHSLFTQYLLEGLRGGIVSDDGIIRIFQVFDYIKPRVRQAQPQQTPVFKADIEDNFAVALYRGGIKGAEPKDAEGFRYDGYLVYANREPDRTYVWETLEPRLTAEGLRIAVAHDVEAPGVERIIGVQEVVLKAKRVVALLSPQYFEDPITGFIDVLAQAIGIEERQYRLLPAIIMPLGAQPLPPFLKILITLDLAHPRRSEREMQRLIDALKGPLPRR
jgi:hypothetical protein